MTNGNMIIIGMKWDGGSDRDGGEVTLAGRGDRLHCDRMLTRVPERHRKTLAHYLAPFLEGGKPKAGVYEMLPCKPYRDEARKTHVRIHEHTIMWWKAVEVVS